MNRYDPYGSEDFKTLITAFFTFFIFFYNVFYYIIRICQDLIFFIFFNFGHIFSVTVYDGKEYWLGDGFHRVEGHKKAGKTEIDADIHQGSQRDAVLHSVGANATHGLRRTNEDKRRAVTRLLKDNEWRAWSNNTIAQKCGVSLDLVNRMRSSLNDSLSERTYTTKHGTQATMKTTNIGRTPRPSPPEISGERLKRF